MPKQLTTLFLFFSLAFTGVQAGDNLDELLFEMLELNYDQARYKAGLNRTHDVGYRLVNQKGKASVHTAQLYAWRGLFLEALSDFNEAKNEIEKARKLLSKVNLDNEEKVPQGYVDAVIVLSRAYMNYGGYLKAEQWLLKGLDVEELKETHDFTLHYYLNYNLYKRGFYNSVMENLPEEINRLKEAEKTDANNIILGKYYLLYMDVLYENGEYETMTKYLGEHEKWMEKTFGYKHGFKAQWEYRKGLLASVNEEYKDANKHFKNAAGASAKYYEKHAPFYAEVQRKRIDNLMLQGKIHEANYWNNDLDVKIHSYYGKKSLAYLHNELVDIEEYLKLELYRQAEKEIEIYSSVTPYYPKVHEERLKVAPFLYEVYIKANQIKKAEELLNNSIEAAKYTYGEDAPAYHFWKIRQARFDIQYSDKFEEAENIYLESIFKVLHEEVAQTNPMYYEYAFDLTDLYVLTEQYDEADKFISEMMLEMEQHGKESHYYAFALRHKAELHISNGEYNLAQEEIEEALAIYKKFKSSDKIKKDFSAAYRTLAQLKMEIGDFDGALDAFLSSDKILQERGRYSPKPSVEEIAQLNIFLGKYEKTEQELKEVIKAKKKNIGEQHWSLIGPLNDLALLYIETGEFTNAEKSLSESSKLVKQTFGDKSTKYAEVLLLYKRLYSAIGDYEKAEKAIGEVVTILQNNFGENHIKVANPMSQQALEILHNHKKEMVKAVKDGTPSSRVIVCEGLLEKSQKIIKESLGTQNPSYAEALKNAGIFYLQLSQLEKATSHIEESRDIWVAILGKENVRSARLDFIRGNIAYYEKEYSKALDYFKRSTKAYASIFDDKHPDYVESLGMESRMYFILDNPKEAVRTAEESVDKSLAYINTIFSGLSERGKANYWEKVKGQFEYYKTLAFTYHTEYPDMIGKVFDINLQTKAILLNASLKVKEQIMSSGDSTLVSNYIQWATLKENLATAVSMSPEQRRLDNINIAEIESDVESLEKYLAQHSSVFLTGKSKDDTYEWESLRSAIGKNDAVVEIIPFRKFEDNFTDSVWYAYLKVDRNTKRNPEFILNKEGMKMNDNYIKYYRNSIIFSSEDNKSYERFWKPVEQLVGDLEGTIYMAVDGAYSRLNLENIRLPEGGFVINKYDIALIGTSRDLLDEAQNKKNNHSPKTGNEAVLVGNPSYYEKSYDSNFKTVVALEGTEEEVKYLGNYLSKNQWKSNLLLNDKATEEAIKQVNNPTVFHIATHGFYVEERENNELDDIAGKAVKNPLLRSGLLLRNGGQLIQNSQVYEYNKEDGILTAYEAMNLNLDNTDLVVLSACETGLGEIKPGEGVFGLQRAFTVAGADNIIISLFKVSDEATKEFMILFYEKWVGGLSKRVAFQEAKKELMKKYENPKLWGAFLMIGVE